MDSDDDSDEFDPELNQAVLESLNTAALPELDIEDIEQEISQPERQCESLVSLAARVTGKHYPCSALDNHDVLKVEHIMKKVLLWTFPQSEEKLKMIATLDDDVTVWTSGEKMVKFVEDIHQVGFSISGIARNDEKSENSSEASRVSLTFEKQRVISTCCSICPGLLWCRHIVAVALYRIRNQDKVPIHLPIMDVLSSMSRQQLQKVMQYAIYDDPGGLIPRLFKYINDVRNPDSDLNQVNGLPDPSFGMDPDKKSTLDLSIQNIQEKLVEAIQNMRWSSNKYPSSFDFVEKQENSFYKQHFGKIKALVENEETEIAGRLLINLASSTIDVLHREYSSDGFPCVKWLVQDIERFFSCFIITCNGPIREQLIEKSLELNRIINGLDSDIYLKPSEWVTLKLRNVSHSELATRDVLGAAPNAPFYQSLCASFVLDAPSPIQDLLNGKQTNTLTLFYKEPLSVMMLRFDSLLLLGHQDAEKKLCKMGVLILRRLLKLSSKLTIAITGPNQQTLSEETTGLLDETQPSSAKRPRLDDNEENSDNQEDEIDDKEWQSLSKANVSYCLLYICYALYQIPNMVEFCDLELSVVMNATLRALEMGRYRYFAPADSISPVEFSWLTKMENSVIMKFAEFQSSGNQNLQLQKMFTCQMYTSGLREKGVGFYGNHMALKLIKTLIEQESVVDLDMKLRLYVEILCWSDGPMMNLKIPEKNDFDSKNKKDLKDVYNFFFERLFENSSENREPVVKVLQHLEVSNDIEFMEMSIQVLQLHMASLNNDLKLQAMKIVLRVIQQHVKAGENKYHLNVYETLKTTKMLAMDIDGHNCITLLLSGWEDVKTFFYNSHVSEVAGIIGDRIKGEAPSLSVGTVDVLCEYLTAEYQHGEEVCVIIQGLATGYWRSVAICMIIGNHENYSPAALLKLAKMEHEIQSVHEIVEEVHAHNAELFSQDVFELVTKALDGEKLVNESESENDSPIELCHLEWCFSALANRTSICDQFCGLVEKLSVCGCSPNILVGFLNNIKDVVPLLHHAKSLFRDQLVRSYYDIFEIRLKKYYGPSCYNSILNDMSTARENCIKYVGNGGSLFKTMVVLPIRRRHRGKRKFLRLMDSNFKHFFEDTDI